MENYSYRSIRIFANIENKKIRINGKTLLKAIEDGPAIIDLNDLLTVLNEELEEDERVFDMIIKDNITSMSLTIIIETLT